MVGGHDDEVVRCNLPDESRQPRIERFQRRRIPRHVAPMAELRVEIHQVCEEQAASHPRPHRFDPPHSFRIAAGRESL